MTRILLEGNIAAGKTTLMKRISDINYQVHGKRVEVVKEPVKIWTNSPAGNLLTASNNKEINQTLFQVSANFEKNTKKGIFSLGLRDVNHRSTITKSAERRHNLCVRTEHFLFIQCFY